MPVRLVGQGSDPLAELPLPPAFDQWPAELGEPDALVTIPVQPIKLPGPNPTAIFSCRLRIRPMCGLRAAIIRPSNYRSVHLIWSGLAASATSGTPDNSTYESHIAEFVPGYKSFVFPTNSYVSITRSTGSPSICTITLTELPLTTSLFWLFGIIKRSRPGHGASRLSLTQTSLCHLAPPTIPFRRNGPLHSDYRLSVQPSHAPPRQAH